MNELLDRFGEKSLKGIRIQGLLAGLCAILILLIWADSFKRILLPLPWIAGLIILLLHQKEKIDDGILNSSYTIIWMIFALFLSFFEEASHAGLWTIISCFGILLFKHKSKRIFSSALLLPLIFYYFYFFIFDQPSPEDMNRSLIDKLSLSFGFVLLLFLSFSLVKAILELLKERDQNYKHLRDILNHIPADIVTLDREKRHIFVSETAIKNPEVREFMIGRTVFDYCEFRNKPIELAQKRDANLEKVLNEKTNIEWEEDFITPKGEITYIRRITPVVDDNGEVDFLIAYGIEITQRKKAEAELEKREAIQKAINYFSKSLFGQNTETDIVWDIAENCIHYLGFEDCVIYLLDTERNVLIQKAVYGPKTLGNREILNPIEIPLGEGIVGSAAKSGKSERIDDASLDERYIVDDEVRYSELAVPIIGPLGVLGVIDSEHPGKSFYTKSHQEILEVIASIAANKLIKARADQALLEAKETAEAATRAKSSFLSTMSHEIRTPMNAVIGIAHLLIEDNPQKKQLPSLQALQFSAKHLLSLINDILDYSKIEAGKLSFEAHEFNLSELFDNVEKTFSFKANDKNIHLNKDIPKSIDRYIIGDWVRLNQVLTNLMGNALKFTEKGQVRFGYCIEEENSNKYNLRFYVADTGIGIAREKIANIFQQFTQASEQTTRKYGGTGLGLAICKKLVELQGGEIGLDSELGKGTEFWFRLSFEKGKFLQEEVPRKDIKKWRNQSLEGMQVLLVEDNQVNVLVAQKFLKKWKIEVDVAGNGAQALDKISEQNYHLVLMDLNMPVMDGITATQKLRARGESLPIIALTADVSEKIKDEILSSGMNAYLTKPFNPEILFETLNEYYLAEIF